MLKPLTQKQIDKLISVAINAFGDKGYYGASINKIAKDAHLSVGVIYKYYEDKEALFTACVKLSLEYLDSVFDDISKLEDSLTVRIENLIIHLQNAARSHPEYFKLYHQIIVSGSPHPDKIAHAIEGPSAALYSRLLEEAQDAGIVRDDLDPKLFAFFFDNLMMMLHFSYACDYYKDRFREYCGEETPVNDEKVREQLMKFITAALGLS